MEQHIRRETFGWKATSRKGRGRDAGWTARQAIGEALRQGDRFPHVEEPLPPTPMRLPRRDTDADGSEDVCLTIPSLMAEVDRVAEAARIVDTLGRTRRLPPTTSVLCSDVVSTPWKTAEVRADPGLGERVDAYLRDALAWIVEDIERRGGRVIAAVVHYDENQVHMHVLSIAEHGLARDLHPGYIAKAKVLDRAIGPDGKVPPDAHHGVNEAYKNAMRAFLDDFYREVAVHHGLDRRSAIPVRRREWLEVRLKRLRTEVSSLETAHDDLGRKIGERQETVATLDARIGEIDAKETAAADRVLRAQAEARDNERALSLVERRCVNGRAELEKLAARWRRGRDMIEALRSEHAGLTAQVECIRPELDEATRRRDAATEAADNAEAARTEALKATSEREGELAERAQTLERREGVIEERYAALERREEQVAACRSKASELTASLRIAHEQVDRQKRWVHQTTDDLDTTLRHMAPALTTSLMLLLERTDDETAREIIEDVLALSAGFENAARSIRERSPQPFEDMRCSVALLRRTHDTITSPAPALEAPRTVVGPG